MIKCSTPSCNNEGLFEIGYKMDKYMLRLFNNGDIDIIKQDDFCIFAYSIVYHKTYKPNDDLKENLINAYKEWEKLTNKNN